MDYNKRIRNSGYVDGNVVRKPQETQRRRRTYVDGRRVANTRAGIKQKERLGSYSIKYVFGLVVSAVMIAVALYLNISTMCEIKTTRNSIANLKNEIADIAAENDSYGYNVDSYVDTEYIITTAKEELGMVEATDEQISFYKRSVPEYVEQIDDIPEK